MMATISSFFAVARASGVGYLCIKSKNTGMACLPWVRLRKVTAIKRRRGLWASRSWMSPNFGADRRGKGMQEIVPGDRGFWTDAGKGRSMLPSASSRKPALKELCFLGVTGAVAFKLPWAPFGSFLVFRGEMGGVK